MRRPALSVLTWYLGLLAALLAGCDMVPIAPVPDERDPGALITDCLPPLVFEGEGSIADLGLVPDLPGLGARAEQRGAIRITRDSVRHEDFLPPDVPVTVDEGQLLCMTFADGTGLTLMLPVPFPKEQASGRDSFDWAPIIVGAVVVAVVGISAAAFRKQPSG